VTKDLTNEDNMERRIEGQARDLARVISTAPPGQRERLREMAVHLLRDEVEIIQPIEIAPAANASVNPFAMGIPLVLVGAILVILFPPVGLLLFAAAALVMVWGVGTVFFARRDP
jgi:hypothetical protein